MADVTGNVCMHLYEVEYSYCGTYDREPRVHVTRIAVHEDTIAAAVAACPEKALAVRRIGIVWVQPIQTSAQ